MPDSFVRVALGTHALQQDLLRQGNGWPDGDGYYRQRRERGDHLSLGEQRREKSQKTITQKAGETYLLPPTRSGRPHGCLPKGLTDVHTCLGPDSLWP